MHAEKNGNSQIFHKKNGSGRTVMRRNVLCSKTKLIVKKEREAVTPMEITRYVNTLNKSNKKMNSNVLSKHIERLQQSCIVKVRRDNLDDLRHRLLGTTAEIKPDNVSIYCKLCGKLYTSLKKLQYHHENIHSTKSKPQKKVRFSDQVIIHEVTDYRCCRKCTKSFQNHKLLMKHMKETHKKLKCYICNYCSKEFVDPTIFKVHIKLHCDACTLLLPTRAKYLEHRRNICKITKRYRCKTCNETCFKYMDLKDHSYIHIGTFFICDICKEQFQTYCQVAHHIGFLHSNQRPKSLYVTTTIDNEKLYQCNFCEETFLDKILIEKHIEGLPDLCNSVTTGYKDYYFCELCLTKFVTEKKMLQHKWKHFIKKDSHPKTSVDNPVDKMVFKLNEIPKHFLIPKVIIRKTKDIEQKVQNILVESEGTLSKENVLNSVSDDINLSLEVEPLNPNVDISETKESERDIHNTLAQPESTLSEENNLISVIQDNNLDSVPQGNNLNTIKEHTDLKLLTEENTLDSGDKCKKKVKRKITFSKYQCQNCSKYFSTGYCLRRHISRLHQNYEDLQCKVCEEIFVWPSLLASHKCIRLHHPEMPFDDARPEIQFENLHEIQNGHNLNGDNTNYIDFDILDPIVNIIEEDEYYIPPVNNSAIRTYRGKRNSVTPPNQTIGYKLVLQEVPIEF